MEQFMILYNILQPWSQSIALHVCFPAPGHCWQDRKGRGVQEFVEKWRISTQLGTCKFEFGTTDRGYRNNRREKDSLEHGVEEMSMKHVFLYSRYIASRRKKFKDAVEQNKGKKLNNVK